MTCTKPLCNFEMTLLDLFLQFRLLSYLLVIGRSHFIVEEFFPSGHPRVEVLALSLSLSMNRSDTPVLLPPPLHLLRYGWRTPIAILPLIALLVMFLSLFLSSSSFVYN
jgi:hypothetical protein